MLPTKANEKEIKFMEIVSSLVQQYLEITEEEAMDFTIDLTKKMDYYKLRIK